MAKKEQVSICINDLFEASKAGHPAIITAKNGKKYAYVDIWENDTPDQYGNDFSVSLYDKEAKKATYIGNGKKYKPQAQAATPPPAPVQMGDDDLPF
jgi:hypothetical protein